MIVASRITLSSYTRCFQTLPSSTELELTHRQGHLNFKDWKGSGSFKPGRCWGNSKNITYSLCKGVLWLAPVAITTVTEKAASSFSGCRINLNHSKGGWPIFWLCS